MIILLLLAMQTSAINSTAESEYVQELINIAYLTHLEFCGIMAAKNETKVSLYACVLENGLSNTGFKSSKFFTALDEGLEKCGEKFHHKDGFDDQADCIFYQDETIAKPFFQCTGTYLWEKVPLPPQDIEKVLDASEKCIQHYTEEPDNAKNYRGQ